MSRDKANSDVYGVEPADGFGPAQTVNLAAFRVSTRTTISSKPIETSKDSDSDSSDDGYAIRCLSFFQALAIVSDVLLVAD